MKVYSFEYAEKQIYSPVIVEKLTVAEMSQIRGGLSDEKSKTKEIDIYDNREK